MMQQLGLTILVAVVATPAAFAADAYTIDPVHSAVLYKIGHMEVSNSYGAFTDFTGTVTFDATGAAENHVKIEVKAASVESFNKGRNEHLSGPDFFSAKQFPVISFESTAWKKVGDSTYEVTGDVTLLGTTKSVTATAEYLGSAKGRKGEDLIGMEAKLTLKRSEFGMSYGLPGVGDEVELTIAIEASK